MGCSLDMTTPPRLAATWPLFKPPGIRPSPHPLPGHVKALRYLPPPSTLHSNSIVHLPWELCNSCVFMASCRCSFTSLQLQPWRLLLLIVMGSPKPQFLVSILKRQDSRALASLCIAFELWCDFSWAPCKSWRSPLTMPRPQGKPKRGAAWYLARGRKPSASDIPAELVDPLEAFPAAIPAIQVEPLEVPAPEALLADPPLWQLLLPMTLLLLHLSSWPPRTNHLAPLPPLEPLRLVGSSGSIRMGTHSVLHPPSLPPSSFLPTIPSSFPFHLPPGLLLLLSTLHPPQPLLC
jgi:hypothetical protein